MIPSGRPEESIGPDTYVGKYRILCELGRGALAVVYLGRAGGRGSFKRLFAIKMLHANFAQDRAFIEMFLNEARIAARVHHPNVIAVYDIDVESARHYIAMDYMSGENVAATMRRCLVRRVAFPTELAAYVIGQACEGLHAAHELTDESGKPLGVVHRDISAQNIMIGYDGTVRLMDFGMAKAANAASSTKPGSIKGTVAYMSPEQVRGQPLDRRSDVFAIGVLLWEMTVGRRLFRARALQDTMLRILEMPVSPPTSLRPQYPAKLERVVMRALARNPAERHPTARELGEELFDWLASDRRFVRPANLERFMKELFGDLYRERAEMERKASAEEMPGHLDALHARDTRDPEPANEDPAPSGPEVLNKPTFPPISREALRPTGLLPRKRVLVPVGHPEPPPMIAEDMHKEPTKPTLPPSVVSSTDSYDATGAPSPDPNEDTDSAAARGGARAPPDDRASTPVVANGGFVGQGPVTQPTLVPIPAPSLDVHPVFREGAHLAPPDMLSFGLEPVDSTRPPVPRASLRPWFIAVGVLALMVAAFFVGRITAGVASPTPLKSAGRAAGETER